MMPNPVNPSTGLPSIFFDVSRNLGRGRDYPDDAPVSQSLVDELSNPVLNLRQRLLYSNPRLSGLPQSLDPAGAPPPDFKLKIPAGLDSGDNWFDEMISAFYTLSAKGKQDESLFDRFDIPKEPDTFLIHTLIGGRPASSLQVAFYAPGCQLKIVQVSDLSAYSGNESFECIKLPKITFTGQIISSNLLDGKTHKIEIRLFNSGEDGSPYFDITLTDEAIPDENGVFHAEIPDFSHDPASGSAVLRFSTEGYLDGAWAPVKLIAADGAANSNGDMRLMSNYGGVVTFHALSNSR
jgi:hypothetical protein